MSEQEPLTTIVTPVRVEYDYSPGEAQTKFLRKIEQGTYTGQRCPKCKKVYVPPRGSCPTCGVSTEEEVELTGTGTITAFCIVNIPFAGQAVECPYVSATIQLDLRPEVLLVGAITTNLPFTNAGGQVDVTAKVESVVNEPRSVSVSYTVRDSAGDLLFTDPSPQTLALNLVRGDHLSEAELVELERTITQAKADG